MPSEKKYRVRFFFDYGAGGCLWADNDRTRQDFGIGPLDRAIAERTNRIPTETLKLIEELDERHADYYNKDYPPDPSLWSQSECDRFNEQVDILLTALQSQLALEYEIIDLQPRYAEEKTKEKD